LVKFRILYITPMPSTDSEFPWIRVDTDTPSHSTWSKSSAACPRPRGGHQKSEKLARGAFATLEKWGPRGRAHIWVVFSCKSAEWDEWRGPKGRADASAVL